MKRRVTLQVNGVSRTVQVEPRALLALVLRDDLNLMGPHVGCDTSQCGACTVLIAPEFGTLVDTKLDTGIPEDAARLALAGKDIGGDVQAPADYRRHLGQVAARRAVELAYERAGE